ncbi:hypothetical protein OH77DRAFT_1056118 [Trametes cingulata]|nr:hypothetical protein OH77DRAFT_1056118 [Trametes cingulata]
MMTTMLTSVPVEVWELVAGPLRIRDLPPLLLSSKLLNQVFTPVLYRHIQLNDEHSAKKCSATLASDPATLSLGRSLAGMVQVFYLSGFDLSSASRRDDEAIEALQRLERAISQMSNLRRFVACQFKPFTPSLLAAVFNGAASTLQSLHVELQSQQEWLCVEGCEGNIPEDFRPQCPGLSMVDVTLKQRSQVAGESSYRFLERLLSSHAAQLRILSFASPHHPDLVFSLLRQTTSWPVLEILEIDQGLLRGGPLPETPQVRVLVVRSDHLLHGYSYRDNGDGDDDPMDVLNSWALDIRIPETAFTKLEELHCSHEVLHAFLPPDGELHRPISKIELDDANYWGAGTCLYYTIIPPWKTVRRALSHLPSSGGPVRELAFIVCGLDFERFMNTAGPYLSTLERLLLVMYAPPVHAEALGQFGERLFAHMPHLQAFFMSEGPHNPGEARPSLEYSGDHSQQLRWLQEWEVHTPALTMVGFTKDKIWVKTERGWVTDGMGVGVQ